MQLLERGADIRWMQDAPLSHAGMNGHDAVVAMLLARRGDGV